MMMMKMGCQWNSARTLLVVAQRKLSNVRPSPQRDSLTWSYASCPSPSPLEGITIGQLLDQRAQTFADREALVSVHQQIRKTYEQIASDVDNLASGFLALGLRPGDRIGMWGNSSYEWYLTQMAAGKAGLILVNVNPAYQPMELMYCINKVGMKAIVSDRCYKTQNYYAILKTIMPEMVMAKPGEIVSEQAPTLSHVIIISPDQIDSHYKGVYDFHRVMSLGGTDDVALLSQLQQSIQTDDPCNIQFTSGTTGQPKGACLSHHNIINNAKFIGLRVGYDQKPHRICCPVPQYHTFGCVIGNICSLFYGATIVLPARHFNAKASLQAVRMERCTTTYGTPTMFMDMVNLHDEIQDDLSSLETSIMTGSPCPDDLGKKVIDRLNVKNFVICFGMTESSPVTLQTFPGDSTELKTTTVGFPSEHTEVKVVDQEGKVVPIGTSGELCTRGYSNMLGYWNDPERTSEIIKNHGWLYTGDLAVMLPNGYCRIVGRLKNMVIRGGENVYPREIEQVLNTHPDVQDSYVVGVPDDRMGEELCAWIKVKPNVEEFCEEGIRDFCREKMAHFKVPKYMMRVNSFPLTATGKVQKFKMREESIKKLKLQVQHV